MAVPPDLSICAPRNVLNRHQHQQGFQSHFSRLKPSVFKGGICIIFVLYFRLLDLKIAIKMLGGEGGIRTHVTVAGKPHFECGAFDHSATSPRGLSRIWQGRVVDAEKAATYSKTVQRLLIFRAIFSQPVTIKFHQKWHTKDQEAEPSCDSAVTRPAQWIRH